MKGWKTPIMRLAAAYKAAGIFLIALTTAQAAEPAVEPALSGRLIVGYQGWFGCPDDFSGNKKWQHWFAGPPDAQSMTVDLLPSLTEFNPKDLCDTGLKRRDGSAVRVFSSQNPRIVDKHFEWMKENGIDGVAFQRFVTQTRQPDSRKRSDNVLAHVRRSAQQHGRIFYVTYDVSGADPGTLFDDIRSDWKYLTEQLKITQSPAYLKHGGKTLVQLWGLGFQDRPGTAEEAGLLIADLKSGRAGLVAAAVVGGVPTGWRTLTGDSKREPGWAAVYRSYDVISPWAVGRFADETGADNFRRSYLEPDIAEARKFGRAYMPVVFPGFSWRNLMASRGLFDKAILDQIPRRCGRFMWRQVFNALELGADGIYAAMFDEVDEGTALFKIESKTDLAPVGARLVRPNDDGCALPEDGYLRITGKAARLLRNHVTAPPKAVEDALHP